MRVGVATDHGGFSLKEDLVARLRAAGHEVVDFGAYVLAPGDDYPTSSAWVAGRSGHSSPGNSSRRFWRLNSARPSAIFAGWAKWHLLRR